MQFLWKYVDDMVGKGLSFFILGKMFFYAALSLIPMALPLSILLASLMTFGNLGENFELLAMKASGISLLRIMRPVIILVVLVAIGAFVFQNNVLPPVQIKLWTLVRSIKLKSPELDIPEKTFYKEIYGYNVYVERKDKNTGIMHNMMIYDFSDGFDNARVTVADSGKLKASTDKQYLILSIYSGESFANLKKQSYRNRDEKIPYRRDTFHLKEMLIAFDANFKMEDESIMSERDFSKDLQKLRVYIDSACMVRDSLDRMIVKALQNHTYRQALQEDVSADIASSVDFQSFLEQKNLDQQQQIIQSAKYKAEDIKNGQQYERVMQKDRVSSIIGHKIEFHRKFTLSFACLIFLFIGIPLGAIIRKGGFGLPAVISVLLFLFYYSIDIFSIKLAKQSVLSPWVGAWLSSFVLSALGAFFTYAAINDSIMLSAEAWAEFFKKIKKLKNKLNI